MKSNRYFLLTFMLFLFGCSKTYISRGLYPHQDVIEVDVVKPPNLIVFGDTAYYAEDSTWFLNRGKTTFSPDSTSEFVPIDKMPFATKVVKPKCPPDAREKSISGKTKVKMLVDTLGNPRRAIILESSNNIFNECSLIAGMQCKFTPTIVLGRPVKIWVVLPYSFNECR